MAKLLDALFADPGTSKWVKDAARSAIMQSDLLGTSNEAQMLANAIFGYVKEKLGKPNGNGRKP